MKLKFTALKVCFSFISKARNHAQGRDIFKIPPTEECSPENGVCCVMFTVHITICAFRPDTSGLIKQTFSYTLMPEMNNTL